MSGCQSKTNKKYTKFSTACENLHGRNIGSKNTFLRKLYSEKWFVLLYKLERRCQIKKSREIGFPVKICVPEMSRNTL